MTTTQILYYSYPLEARRNSVWDTASRHTGRAVMRTFKLQAGTGPGLHGGNSKF
jgi:hypothetical protein